MAETFRPLSIGELLDRTFFIYRRHFLMFFGIAAVTGVVTLAINLFTLFFAAAPDAGLEPGNGAALMAMVFGLVSIVITLCAVMMAQGATVVAVSEVQLEREASIGTSFEAVRPILGALIGTALLAGVKIFLGFLLLIVPGIMLFLRYALVIPVAVLERRFGGDASDRSSELTLGSRGRIFVTYLILLLLFFVVTIILSVPVGMVFAFSAQRETGVLVTQIWQYVSNALLTPMFTIAVTLMYYDQRVRNEAFDLEHLMSQLDRSAGAPTS